MSESTESAPLTEHQLPSEAQGDQEIVSQDNLDWFPEAGASAEEPVQSTANHSQQEESAADSSPATSSPTAAPRSPRTTNADDSRERFTSAETISRVSLGGALMAVDALNEILEQVEETEARADSEPRTPGSVLVPLSEWGDRFGESPGLAARHVALGRMIDARSGGGRTFRLLNNITSAAVTTMELVFSPITNSRVFRPLAKGFDRAVERGEYQVNYWKHIGRSEDIHSRRIAESALTIVADDSMDEIIENERIQEFVQEMMAAQSLGIIDEVIEEIRERGFSSDVFFEKPFRRLFRRADREEIPRPDFDPRLVRSISKRHLPAAEDGFLGYYAGFTSRLLAFVVDVGLVLAFIAMTAWLFQTIGNFVGESPNLESLALSKELLDILGALFSSLNAITVVAAYAFVFWSFAGQTPGMMLMGLRIVNRTGGHANIWKSFLRLIGFVISIAFFFLGFAWVLIDDKREGWHDKIAGTYVVYAWDAHPDETFLTYRMSMDR